MWEVMNSYDYRDLMDLPVDDGSKWQECNTVTHAFLSLDFNMNWGYALAPLLDDGIPVLIYTGDKDYIANWIGANEWTDGLVWEAQNEFQFTPTKEWRTTYEPEKTAGFVKQFLNFSVVRVKDAGHMVPMDQPARALDLI